MKMISDGNNKNKIRSVIERIRLFLIERRLQKLRKNLENQTPTIIANNCNGTFMYHDLELRFCSPTINLFFSIQDYLKFVSHMDMYLAMELEDITEKDAPYPMGRIVDITLHFVHYKDFKEASMKWKERVKRIQKENLYLVMNEGRGCTYEDLKAFDALPYEHKVVFTHKPYPEIKSAYYINGFEKQESCDYLFNYPPRSLKRYYEQFDYVHFLNQM